MMKRKYNDIFSSSLPVFDLILCQKPDKQAFLWLEDAQHIWKLISERRIFF